MSRELTFESILKRDNNWILFKELYKDRLPDHVFQETEKMLACRTKDCGFATYICPHCGKTKIIIHNPERQKLLLNSAAKIIKDIFSQKQTLTIGMVLVLHPFGDDLKHNFHVHAIVSCGGLSKNMSQLVPVDYIDWCFKSLTNGFVIFADSIIKGNKKEVLRYIARYTKHPPISNRRIIDYNGSSVTFTYESRGEELTKSMPKLEFILAVLQLFQKMNHGIINHPSGALHMSEKTVNYICSKCHTEENIPQSIINYFHALDPDPLFNRPPSFSCEKCGYPYMVPKNYLEKNPF